MNPDLKKRWVAALRSGEYEQGEGLLSYTETASGITYYCCIGVLCDILKDESDLFAVSYFINKVNYYGYSYNTLSEEQREYVKILSPIMKELIDLNDNQLATFNEIADYIEENL
jgi:hypothetical protein